MFTPRTVADSVTLLAEVWFVPCDGWMEAANADTTCLWLSRSAARLEIDVSISRMDSARMGMVSLLVPEPLTPEYDGDVTAADEVERESFMAIIDQKTRKR